MLATPLPNGGHVGVVVNRPTPVKLETLFPEHAPSRKVVDPVYAGGPSLAKNIIAVTRQAPEHSGAAISLMPGVFAVIDAPTVDRIIETTPNAARYFVGLVTWEPAELENELRQNAWEVHPADAEAVFRPGLPGCGTRCAARWRVLRTLACGLRRAPLRAQRCRARMTTTRTRGLT